MALATQCWRISPQEVARFFQENLLKRVTKQIAIPQSRMGQEIEKIRDLRYAVDHMENSAEVEFLALPLYGAIRLGVATPQPDDETIVGFAGLPKGAQKRWCKP